MKKTVGLVTLAYLIAFGSLAQAPPTLRAVDAAQRTQAVEDLCKALKENYVFPDVADRAAQLLQKRLAEGAYDKDADVLAFCEDLTKDVRATAKDLHLRVGPAPPGWKPQQDSEVDRARLREEMRKDNFGFEKVEILPGNIGYLELWAFVETGMAGDTAVGAMAFLGNCDALIFDLRQNGGGDPVMIQLLSTYLFKEPTHLNDLYFRKGERRDQFWTLPYVPGRRLPDVPVYVLTSGRTFSGGEEFANNLKVLKRATLIGETTGGGANPGDLFPVGCCFRAFIPTGRAINPTTGTNWEGTGVEPDLKVPARDALRVARVEALKALKAKARSPEEAAGYDWLLEGAEAQAHPASFTAKELEAFAGTYGPRKVWFDAGILKVQREGRPVFVLVPLSGTTFTLEGSDDVRFTFNRGADGKVSGVAIAYSDGRRDEAPRTEAPAR